MERRFYELGKALSKRGHEVHIYTIRYDKHLSQYEEIEGMKVHRFVDSFDYYQPGWRSIPGVLRFSFKCVTKLIGSDFDLYFCGELPFIHSILLSKFKSPIVQHWAEVWMGQLFPIEKLLSKTIRHHTTSSKFTARRLIAYLKVSPDQVTIIPGGINQECFSRVCAHRVWGRIIYLGRLVPSKRIDFLLESFKIIRKTEPNSELYIVGGGPLFPQVKEYSAKNEGVKALGFVTDEEKIRLLKSSSVLVLPSEREGFGFVVIEALAAGTPVVIADFPNNAARYEFSRGCLIAEPNKASLSETVLSLLEDKSLWSTLHLQAMDEAKKYDWKLIAQNFEQKMLSIINSENVDTSS